MCLPWSASFSCSILSMSRECARDTSPIPSIPQESDYTSALNSDGLVLASNPLLLLNDWGISLLYDLSISITDIKTIAWAEF